MEEEIAERCCSCDQMPHKEGCPVGRGVKIKAPSESAAPAEFLGAERKFEETAGLIREECNGIKDMLLAKNRAYGNSALDPVRIFSQADAIEQIRVRIDDKLSRLVRGGEAGEDVVLDLIGYLVLLRVAEKKGTESEGAKGQRDRGAERQRDTGAGWAGPPAEGADGETVDEGQERGEKGSPNGWYRVCPDCGHVEPHDGLGGVHPCPKCHGQQMNKLRENEAEQWRLMSLRERRDKAKAARTDGRENGDG